MSIVRGDILGVRCDDTKKIHRTIRDNTYSDVVHTAIAISPTRCLEMHLGGLRTVKITRHKNIRVFRPPVELRGAIINGIDTVYGEYKWARYNIWQGICQGVKAKFGFWLPFSSKGANCSEVAIRYAEVIGTPDVGDENLYFPGKTVDHILMKGWLEQEEVHN
jgi:hypothetical protein